MPLLKSKSKKAFKENVKTEVDAGRPIKQALAIAYSKRKKMAFGGKAESTNEPGVPSRKPDDMRPAMDQYMGSKWAEGGRVYDREPAVPMRKPDDKRLREEDYMSDQWAGGPDPIRKPDDERLPMDEYMADHFYKGGTVDAIMQKRLKGKAMAEGGEVEGPEHDAENPADSWEDFEEAGLKENYSDSGPARQPLDSNLHGRELPDEDKYDMVSKIMKKLRSR